MPCRLPRPASSSPSMPGSRAPAPPRPGQLPQASPEIRALLLDRSVLVAAAAVSLAAIGWGIIEPLLPAQLVRSGRQPLGSSA